MSLTSLSRQCNIFNSCNNNHVFQDNAVRKTSVVDHRLRLDRKVMEDSRLDHLGRRTEHLLRCQLGFLDPEDFLRQDIISDRLDLRRLDLLMDFPMEVVEEEDHGHLEVVLDPEVDNRQEVLTENGYRHQHGHRTAPMHRQCVSGCGPCGCGAESLE